jgi:hypothetical protein
MSWKSTALVTTLTGLTLAVGVGTTTVLFGGRVRHACFMAKWEKRGVNFDIAPYQQEVPPHLDFTKAPGIVDWIRSGREKDSPPPRPAIVEVVEERTLPEDPYDRTRQHVSPIPDLPRILADHADDDPIFRQLSEAVHLPGATTHYPVQMEQLNEAQRFLACRAYLHLAGGERETGLRDLTTALRLPGRIGDSSATLIPILVEIALLRIATEAIWASLQLETWNDESLATLEAECQRIQLTKSLPAEIIRMIAWDDVMARRKAVQDAKGPVNAFLSENLLMHHLVTGYWLFAEDTLWDPEKNALATDFTPKAAARWEQRSLQLRSRPMLIQVFDGMVAPNMGRVGMSLLETQQNLELASVVCQLKRYHLRVGNYPASLKALGTAVPEDRFLEGSPLPYRRNPDGSFVLYSVGSDGKDDGGDAEADLLWAMLE